MTFATVAATTYLVSSLTGQVMVEKARREGIRATIRAVEARKVEEELSKRLNMLTSLQSIQSWAKAHQFYTADELALARGGKTTEEAASVKPE